MKRDFKFLLFLLCLKLSASAQPATYHYKSGLSGVKNTWHLFSIPPLVFERTQGRLTDLRIYGFKGKDTIEVPYILEESADQVMENEIDFRIINQSQTKEGYYFTFITDPKEIINHIKLSFQQVNFDWTVNLEGSNNEEQWFTLLTGYRILAIQNSATHYRFTDLNFGDSKFKYYRLSIKATEQPRLNGAKILKTTTLKGTLNDIKEKSYQILTDAKNKQSIITVKLPHLTPVSCFKIGVAKDFDYYRPVNIAYAADSISTNEGMTYQYEHLYSGTMSVLENGEFKFKTTLGKHFRITIANNDNQPLHIRSMQASGPVYELIARFGPPDYQYGLYFGNKEVNAPVYELKLFENKIPLGLTALSTGEITENPLYRFDVDKPLFEHKAWLWALMGIIISLLGFFTYKMLKE